MKRYIIKMGTILTAWLSANIGPMHAYFVHGVFGTAIEAHIPFTEPKSNTEVVGNFLLQCTGIHTTL